jgi:phytoene dehydrogenase-like protein
VSDPDVVVIGSGPNGLVAASALAGRGFRVLVLEANPRRAGGALGTEELTLPGFAHDVGAGFFPFGTTSPAFQELDLPGAGVEWKHAKYESCHPALDGTFACIARGAGLATAPFGSARDADAFATSPGFTRASSAICPRRCSPRSERPPAAVARPRQPAPDRPRARGERGPWSRGCSRARLPGG